MVENDWTLIGAGSWASTNCASFSRPQGWSNLMYPEFNRWVKQTAKLF